MIILGIRAASNGLANDVLKKTCNMGLERVSWSKCFLRKCACKLIDSMSENYSLFYDNIESFAIRRTAASVIRAVEGSMEKFAC